MTFIFAALVLAVPDLPIGSFSGRTYGDWTQTGKAFRKGPASGAQLPQLEIVNAADDAVISSEVEGDRPVGTLTSPEFKIERNAIAFRIGGGGDEHALGVELLLRGKVVRTATGRRSDRLMPVSWDVRKLRGQMAQVRVVDEASGDWGHTNVDRIMQTDQPEQAPYAPGPLYHEALRPQFHFTARQWTVSHPEPVEHQEGWINDLNGLIYYDGEWHLFAQRWATCWLHAVSKDLIHWKELQPAFWEESLGVGVQSGTCVVDYANTSGLAKDPKHPAMVAFWSRFDNRSQCLCYSLDHGRTWTHYPGNPTFERGERDPKVFWYSPGKHWVMIMYGDGAYHILNSPDLLHWTDQHHPVPNSFECPDFFELPLDGDVSKKKWVLIQGNGNYSVGTFDGHEFKEEGPRHACDIGPNFYATQSWHNTDTGDGRRIQTAWMRFSYFPGMPFSQMVSFPCQLRLVSTPDGPRVYREPIAEVSHLSSGEKSWKDMELGSSLSLAEDGELFRLRAEVSIPAGSKLTVSYRGVPVTFTSASVASGDAHGTTSEVRTIEMLLDRTSIETFVNGGEISSTRFVLPSGHGLTMSAEGGAVRLKSVVLDRLKSVW